LTTPPIGWERARRIGADAMAEEARARGFAVRRERLIHYDPDRGLYEYRTLSTLDVGSKLGNTTLYLDAMRGRVLRVDLPTGVGAGNTATAWLMALHTAGIGGMPMQVFISLMGGVVVLLSVTGLVIWWRKRRARLQGRHRAAAHKPRGQPGPRAAHGPDAAAIRIPQQNADPYPPNRKNPMTALSQFAITGKWPAVHPERIQLYSLPTPNGVKVSIMLEETGLPYEPHLVRFDMNEQLSPQFLSLNPNNKIPAILDPDGPDGQPLALFESGAILIYLAEKSGQFMPRDAAGRYQTIQWLMFQMGGIGPMFGQLGFFNKFAGKDYEDKRPRDRYVAESRRLLGVLDQRLADRAWIMGDDYTIADMATFPWVNNLIGFYEAADLVGYADFAHVARALNAFVARPGVVKGLGIPARPKAR
jgi:GST-like protein